MKKRLSTSLTFTLKFILPIFWIGGFGINTVMSFMESTSEGLSSFFSLALGTIVLYYLFIRAKLIHIDDEFLYVSNFKKSIKIPFSEIQEVSEFKYGSPRPIFIELKNKTEFGKDIMFLGRTEIFIFFEPHPVVALLNSKIKSAPSFH